MLEFAFAVFLASPMLGLVALTQAQRDDNAEEIRRALRKCGLTLTDAAEIMRLHKSDLCNALAGLQKLDDWRLEMLPPEFHRWRALLKLQRHGVPDLVRVGLKATPTLLEMKKDGQ